MTAFAIGAWVRILADCPVQGEPAQVLQGMTGWTVVRHHRVDARGTFRNEELEKWEPRPGERVVITKHAAHELVGFTGSYKALYDNADHGLPATERRHIVYKGDGPETFCFEEETEFAPAEKPDTVAGAPMFEGTFSNAPEAMDVTIESLAEASSKADAIRAKLDENNAAIEAECLKLSRATGYSAEQILQMAERVFTAGTVEPGYSIRIKRPAFAIEAERRKARNEKRLASAKAQLAGKWEPKR